MAQTGHLQEGERLTEKELIEKLHAKIDGIDWELAKADVFIFISDQTKLDLWSKQFFHDLIEHLKVSSD